MITLMIYLFIFICHIAYSYMHFLLTAFLFEDLVLLSVYYLPLHLLLNIIVLDGIDFD